MIFEDGYRGNFDISRWKIKKCPVKFKNEDGFLRCSIKYIVVGAELSELSRVLGIRYYRIWRWGDRGKIAVHKENGNKTYTEIGSLKAYLAEKHEEKLLKDLNSCIFDIENVLYSQTMSEIRDYIKTIDFKGGKST